MPKMGIPQGGSNPFSQVKINRRSSTSSGGNNPSTQGNNAEVGKALNKLTGKNLGGKVKFVDRDTHNKIGKNQFLQLLTQQLQNQDPMKPMDQRKFAADLAQFSQLEQLTAINNNFEKMVPDNDIKEKFQGATFLGKEIVTKGTSVNFKGEEIDIPFAIKDNAKKLLLRIFDKKGQLTGQIEAENLPSGNHSLRWNGKQVDGLPAQLGEYNLQVHAWDENMTPFKGETRSSGMVTGVNFENGETVLHLTTGKKIFLRDVDQIKMPEQKKEVRPKPMKNPYTQGSPERTTPVTGRGVNVGAQGNPQENQGLVN